MRVIPVIDILNGDSVHAVKGNRDQYKPLKSELSESSEPLKVAKAFNALGFRELYIADLDAIINRSSDFSLLKRIVNETELSLIVDAGITNLERARKLFETGVAKLVIGTETLHSKVFVQDAINQFGCEQIVLSLDLKGGRVLVSSSFTESIEPISLLKEFHAMGVGQVIVLDLSRVGSGEGVDLDLLKRLKAEVNAAMYVGGGIRSVSDLLELKSFGISGALIATSLHTGKIPIETLKHEGML
ncbi:MAG: hypothetical protein GX799_03310 [Crenarchaeota archaeon]|jgi:phosphoribosylformimino-5-aminoimidazole carboxamide ribotide isomerase|nr:hypothetical protein [Thermoproteota archaeon]